jgi:hypothetical protein
MDDHAHYFTMHRRINAAIVLDDAVAGREMSRDGGRTHRRER